MKLLKKVKRLLQKHGIRILIVHVIALCRPDVVFSQQLPAYSQYTFNGFLLNPAVAGSEGYTAINVTSREQWVGIEGAPSTQCISVQTRIMKRNYIETNASIRKRYLKPLRSGRVGLGVYLYRDHIGLSDQTGMQLTYAYHITKTKSQLSFGLTLSCFQYRLNTTALKLPDAKDNLVNNEPLSMIVPDANVGVYYTDKNMFAGFSAYNLTQASIMFGKFSDHDFRMKRHYNIIGGFKYDLDETYTLEPSAYLKMSEQWKPQMDIMAKLIRNNKFWIGLGYRYAGSYIGTIGIKLNTFYVGYSYDCSNNSLSYYSYGTHELMLALKLGDNTRRYKWIERY